MTSIATTPPAQPDVAGPGSRARRRVLRGPLLAVHAVIAFAFPLLSGVGQRAADTKVYLYLDPGRMLERATTMWDPAVAAGTVPHQNIGYLFPMGPYFWLAERIGVPDWVAQRLWIGLASMAAAVGVHVLLRTLDPDGRDLGPAASFVAAATYQLSPYLLPYVARHSVLLGAWAALPWLCAFTARGLRDGGWRWPAWFAVVLALVGSINASSLVFVLLGPVLWMAWALVARQASLRRTIGVMLRAGLLCLGVSLWWIVGLRLQAAYGIDVLRYTETPETVSGTSSAVESVRQLGYWYFYGGELVVPFTPQAAGFQENPVVVAAGFALPPLALAAAVLTRWRYRLLALLFVAVGLMVAVGAHPWGGPALFGRALQRFFTTSSGLALRSTPRVVPLLALGVALLLGAGVAALVRVAPAWKAWALPGLSALLVVNLYPWFTGGLVAATQRFPSELPDAWQAAATLLTERDDGTRVLVLPGTDFAAYRWGFALEPVLPGLTDRPTLQRETVPYGTPGTVDLLLALDRRLQEGTLDPDAVAPVARRLAAGQVLVQHDLAYERYPTTRPRDLWALEQDLPGTSGRVGLGPATANQPERALRDPKEYGRLGADDPPQLTVADVAGALPIVRTARGAPLVLAGDGEGMVDAAAVGLLDRSGLVLASAALDDRQLADALAAGADLVVTDTNRQRSLRWGGLRDNHGPTVAPDEHALRVDSEDQPLTPFPGAGLDARTVAVRDGVATVVATSYGQPLWYTPEDEPANAFDGDPLTDWRVVGFETVRGERLQIRLAEPVTTDRLTLLQTVTLPRQHINDVTLRFDGGSPVHVTLGDTSLAEPGQEVSFPTRTFTVVEIELGSTTAPFDVGLAEVRIPGVTPREVLRLPTDLPDAVGPETIEHRYVVVLTRERSDPRDEFRRDEERAMARLVRVPAERTFAIGGTARLDADAPDDVLDRALGFRSVEEGGLTVISSGRIDGDPRARARAAIDGDAATVWRSPLDPAEPWLAVQSPSPFTVDRLDLQVVADGRHSVPIRLRLEAADGQVREVAVPPVVDGAEELATTAVTVPVDPPLVTTGLRVTVTDLRRLEREPLRDENPVTLPVAIAELGLPGVTSPPPPAALPTRCQPDRVTVGGTNVGLVVEGPVADALAGQALDAVPCDVEGVTLPAGDHEVHTTPAGATGFQIDQVVLGSDKGGAALDLGERGHVPPLVEPPTSSSAVVVEEQDADHLRLRIDDANEPFELVLGQSLSDGWRAEAAGATLASSAPRLVDGYANGWTVTPHGSGPITITLDWTPQRFVPPALAISALSLVACLVLALLPRRRPEASGNEPTARWRRPALSDYARLPARIAWAAGGCITALALLVTTWWAALIAGALVVAALRVRILRPILLAGPLLLAAVGGGVVVGQLLFEPRAGYGWPGLFDPLDVLVWMAVALTLVEVVLSTWAPPPEPAAAGLPGGDEEPVANLPSPVDPREAS